MNDVDDEDDDNTRHFFLPLYIPIFIICLFDYQDYCV